MPDRNRQLIDNIWAAAIDRRTGTAGRKTVAELAAAVDAAVPAVVEALQNHPILSSVLTIGPAGQVVVRDLPGIDIAGCQSLEAMARKLFEITRQRILAIEAARLAGLETTRDDAHQPANVPRAN